MKYAFAVDKKSMAYASTTEKISEKSSLMIAREINGMKFESAKNFLQDMLDGRKSLRGKFYTKSAEGILNLLKSAENNAVIKGIDTAQLKVRISIHKGPNIHRSRRKRSFGTKMKMTNLQVVLAPQKNIIKENIAKEEKREDIKEK